MAAWAALCTLCGLTLLLLSWSGSAQPLPPASSLALGDVQRCLAGNLQDVASSCAAYAQGQQVNGSAHMLRDEVIHIMKQCIPSSNTSSSQTVKILTAAGVYTQLIQSINEVYSLMTGVPILLDALRVGPAYTQKRLLSIANPANESLTHDSWMIQPAPAGDGLASGAFKDLTQLVMLDNRLKVDGWLPALKSYGLLYKSRVIGLPLSAYSQQLIYRRDVFLKNGWQVPRTWWELADMAERVNGTDGMFGFCAYYGPCANLAASLTRLVLASYIQTHGPTQGWVVDADSMEVLLDTPVMDQVVALIRRLQRLSPPDLSVQYAAGPCSPPSFGFEQGKCLMAIISPTSFKYIAHNSRAAVVGRLHGNLGVALVPGSDQVLDRANRTLQPCTAATCPYATPYTHANGSQYLVNSSPGIDANIFPINDKSPQERSFFAYSIISYLASPSVADHLIFHKDSELYPFRTDQLDPQQWAAAGYDLSDATQFTDAHMAANSHPNYHFHLRIPGSSLIVNLLGEIGANATSTNQTSAQIAAAAQARAVAILSAAYHGNWSAAKEELWASLNRFVAPPAPSGTQQPPAAGAQDQEASEHHQHTALIITLSVVAPVLIITLVAIVTMRHTLGSLLGWAHVLRVKHPGPGPQTTLLVTDIENSTCLWEELDAVVMEAAVKLHNQCVRTAAAELQGYESVWEGDSFIIAFPSVKAALQCAMRIQQDLLQLPWAAALLRSEHAHELWLQPTGQASSPGPKVAPAPKALLLKPVSSGKFPSRTLSAPGMPAPAPSPTIPTSLPCPTTAATTLFSSGSPTQAASPGPQLQTDLCQPSHDSTATASDSGQHAGLPSLCPTLSSDGHTLELGGSSQSQQSHPEPAGLMLMPAAASAVKTQWGAEPVTVGQQYSASWRACERGASGAVLAFRGLRVRVGMHAGVASSSDITFNKHSGRYQYTGAVRVMSNTIASAGHGGQTLTSTATGVLLGMTAQGLALPPDCCVFNLGAFTFDSVHDDPDVHDIVCIVPRPLLCRMALHQPLRHAACVLRGCLDAPLPWQAISDGRPQHGPYLACLQLTGIDSLLAWDAREAQQALAAAHKCAEHMCGLCQGVISMDGWAMVRLLGHVPTSGPSPGGRLLAAFPTACAALTFAAHVRARLLQLDWRPELLAHSSCERIGADSMQPQSGMQQAAGQVCLDWRPLAVDNSAAGMPGSPTWHMVLHESSLAAGGWPAQPPFTHSAAAMGYNGTSRARTAVPSPATLLLPAYPAGEVGSWQEPGSLIPTGSDSSFPGAPRSGAGPDAAGASTRPGASAAADAAGGAARPGATAAADGGMRDVKQPATPVAARFRSLFERTKDSAAAPSLGGAAPSVQVQPSRPVVMVADCGLLRGPRLRASVATGPLQVDVWVRGTGRALYSGTGLKRSLKLVKVARAGQIVTTTEVLQLAMPAQL